MSQMLFAKFEHHHFEIVLETKDILIHPIKHDTYIYIYIYIYIFIPAHISVRSSIFLTYIVIIDG